MRKIAAPSNRALQLGVLGTYVDRPWFAENRDTGTPEIRIVSSSWLLPCPGVKNVSEGFYYYFGVLDLGLLISGSLVRAQQAEPIKFGGIAQLGERLPCTQ